MAVYTAISVLKFFKTKKKAFSGLFRYVDAVGFFFHVVFVYG